MENKTIGIILLILPIIAGLSYFVWRDGVVLTMAYLLGSAIGAAILTAGLYFYSKKD